MAERGGEGRKEELRHGNKRLIWFFSQMAGGGGQEDMGETGISAKRKRREEKQILSAKEEEVRGTEPVSTRVTKARVIRVRDRERQK